jgi:membrane associated rhomboid family serine protease
MISITLIIIAITVLVSINAFNNRDLLFRMMFTPYSVHHNKQYERFLGHIFIHADWTHLLFNMFVLYSFGASLEQIFTEELNVGVPVLHFLMLYLGGALFATIIPFNRHKDNPHYMALGASGAVSAILFAFICIKPSAGLTFLFFPFFDIPAYIVGVLYLAYEYYMDKKGGTGIAHDAHLGGALFGIGFMLLFHFEEVKEAILNLF